MKEYEVISVESDWEATENKLNKYAREGWRVVCSYRHGAWFVMERDKSICKVCGK